MLSLLVRWVWRLETENIGYCREVLESKYGGWRKFKNLEVNNQDSIWWTNIKIYFESEGLGNGFEDNIIWKIGDEKNINF